MTILDTNPDHIPTLDESEETDKMELLAIALDILCIWGDDVNQDSYGIDF